MSGSNDDSGRQLNLLVGGDGIVASKASACAKEQRAVLFGEEALFAEIIPDEAVGLGETNSAAITGKLGEAEGAASPDVALVIGSEHVDIERRQAVRNAIVCDLGLSIDETQAS